MTVREEVRALLEALPPGGPIPPLGQWALEIGVSRERVRQILNDLSPIGERARHTRMCGVCGVVRTDTTSCGSLRRAIREGWRRGQNNKWYCPDCGFPLRAHSRLHPDWPHAGTLYARVLEWMESGRPYKPTLIAKELGTWQPEVSRAKSVLVTYGKWRWDDSTGLR